MPIYEFECDACEAVREMKLPYSESNKKLECGCGQVMRRKFSLAPVIIPETGRDRVLADLNSKDDGRGNYPHHKAAMWKGLNQRDPVVGRGFG